MSTFIFHVVFVAVGAVIGGTAGWFLRGSGYATPAKMPSSPPAPAPDPKTAATTQETSPDMDAAEAVLARLHQLTESVAADVGEHKSRVQEISDELTASGDQANVVLAVEKLIKVNEAMQSQLHASEERLQAQANEIESHVKEARTDALTKLANRRAFDDEMVQCYKEFKRSGRPSSVMMIDVDHFKKFNDTFGHQAGDEVLRGVARTLLRSVCGKEIVCRYGGEEFAIIFPGSDVQTAIPAAERARAAIADHVCQFNGKELSVSASGGVAQLKIGETIEGVVKRSDDALYACKENGRNCGYYHDGKKILPMVKKANAKKAGKKSKAADVDKNLTDRQIAGLSDRKSFLGDVDRRVAEQHRDHSPLSILMIGVDRFSQIEEEMGEKASEVVLRAAAQFLKASMRDMDHISIYDHSIFAMLLPGASLTESEAAAERIRAAIERCKLPLFGEELTFTVSVGGAEIESGEERRDFVQRAEKSLLAARETGGNCTFAASPGDRVPVVAAS